MGALDQSSVFISTSRTKCKNRTSPGTGSFFLRQSCVESLLCHIFSPPDSSHPAWGHRTRAAKTQKPSEVSHFQIPSYSVGADSLLGSHLQHTLDRVWSKSCNLLLLYYRPGLDTLVVVTVILSLVVSHRTEFAYLSFSQPDLFLLIIFFN